MAKFYVEVKMFKKKKNKYFPYGNLMTPPIRGWCPRKRNEPIRFDVYEKKDVTKLKTK